MSTNKTKILVMSSVAGAFVGANLRHQMEVVQKEKFQLLRGTSKHETYQEWEKKGDPVHCLNLQEFQKKQEDGSFYWVSEQQEPLYGILKEDVQKAFASKEKLYYLEMPLRDCIHIKTLYPHDVYYLAIDEWRGENEETEETKLIRKHADFFIDSFNYKELEVLENIRKELLSINT